MPISKISDGPCPEIQGAISGGYLRITAVSLAGGAAETWIAVVALLFIGTK